MTGVQTCALPISIATGANAGEDAIGREIVREMLASADRGSIVDIFEAVMKGDIATALGLLKEQNDKGADPAHVLTGLAEFTHLVTRFKVVPGLRSDPTISPEEFTRGSEFAKGLGMAALTRAWQILTRGLTELKDSPRPMASADMVLVRLAYAADLPAPDAAARCTPRRSRRSRSSRACTPRSCPSRSRVCRVRACTRT